jgi:hypothetical protein
MPAITALIYLMPIVLFISLTASMPPQSDADKAQNALRTPMSRAQQWTFVKRYWPGLVALTLAYMMLTAVRDFRDFFQAEIWDELYPPAPGTSTDASVFFVTEIPVAIAVLVVLCLLNLITDNRRSILAQHVIFIVGNCTMLASQSLFKAGAIGGTTWYIGIGVGVYLSYAPIGAMFYDRLMGALQEEGTAVFMINVSDTCGYVGTVVLLIYKSLLSRNSEETAPVEYEPFYSAFVFTASLFCLAGSTTSLIYWWYTTARLNTHSNH